jgi:hypothetical protein
MTDFISTVEAAAALQVNHTQLENWRSRNFGPPYFKVGGAVLYDRDELLRWFKARRIEPSSPTASASLRLKQAPAANRSKATASRSRKTDAHAAA